MLGFVVYCGVESRLHLNADPYRKKNSKMEQTINTWVLYLLLVLILFVLGSVLGFYYFNNYSISEYPILQPIIMFTLLYNNIIPISLFVAIDIIRVIQNIRYKNNNEEITFNTDIVNENLGQIDYLITDKTGTLTEKKLTVVSVGLENIIYEQRVDVEEIPSTDQEFLVCDSQRNKEEFKSFNELKVHFHKEISTSISKNFLKCMALCNNLHQKGKEFLGSQEEISMIDAANFFGCTLRKPIDKVYELTFKEQTHSYNVICSRQLSKELKRSRILFEDLSCGGGLLCVKGHPDVITHLLNISNAQRIELKTALADFENNGTRCFIFAYKKFSQTELIEHKIKVEKIRRSFINKEGRLEGFFRKIEKDVKYLGVIGITEKLYPETAETLRRIQQAGIRVFMVSSDTRDNSYNVAKEANIIDTDGIIVELVNIKTEAQCAKALKKSIDRLIFDKRSCTGLFRPSISNFAIRGLQRPITNNNNIDSLEFEAGLSSHLNEEVDENEKYRPQSTNNLILRMLTKHDLKIDEIMDQPFDPKNLDYSVIIDKTTFKTALNDQDCRKMLVCLLACAKSAIFTELMPRDKGCVVKLLKDNISFNPLIAAVGTGEGDISILQLADIGIGIRKKEDSLAMNYSDVTINYFHQLNELILTQGHYNYARLSRVVFLFLYKNCVLAIVLLVYTFLSSYSGTSIFNSSALLGHNLFFTTFPIIIIGIYDEDINSSKIIMQPQLYMLGIKNSMFNTKKLFMYLSLSVIQGIILSILCYFCLPLIITSNGNPEDINLLGTFTYITLAIMILMQIYIETYCYSIKYYISILLSIICIIIALSIESNTDLPDTELLGITTELLKSGFSMISICFTSIVCIVPLYFIYM